MTTYAMEQLTIELVSHRLEYCYRVLFIRQVTWVVFELIAMWRHWCETYSSFLVAGNGRT